VGRYLRLIAARSSQDLACWWRGTARACWKHVSASYHFYLVQAFVMHMCQPNCFVQDRQSYVNSPNHAISFGLEGEQVWPEHLRAGGFPRHGVG
jgi:hypothetical protein